MFILITGVALGLVGCVETTHEPEPLTVEAFCQALPEATCGWLERCFGALEGSCEQQFLVRRLALTCDLAQQAVAQRRVAFDSERAGLCLEAHSRCGFTPPLLELEISDDPGAACRGVFTGLAPLGAACHTTSSFGTDECAEGFCQLTAGDCPGTCVAWQEAGQACDEQTRCHPASYCAGGTCQPRRVDGAPCFAPPQCLPGSTCFQEALSENQPLPEAPPGTCRRSRSLGQSCGPLQACTGYLQCTEGVCAIPQQTGSPCQADEDCRAGHRCLAIPPGSFNRECWPAPVEEQPCDLYRPINACAAPLVCYAVDETTPIGVCRAAGAEGDACSYATCTEDLWCDAAESVLGQCRPRGATGEPCDFMSDRLVADQCNEGLYCMSDGRCSPPADLGGPCSALAESCQGSLWCDPARFTCQEPLGQNEPCDSGLVESCGSGLLCTCPNPADCIVGPDTPPPQTVCLPKLAMGEPCDYPEQCLSGYCEFFSQEHPSCGDASCGLVPGLVLPE